MMKSLALCVLICGALMCGSARAVLFNDGGVHEITGTISSDVAIEDSPPGDATLVRMVTGGWVPDVEVFDESRFEMLGGILGSSLDLYDQSTALIAGGSVRGDSLWISNSGVLTITGGEVTEDLRIVDRAQLIVHGTEFTVDGVPTAYGQVAGPVFHLEGDLLNGYISTVVQIRDSGTVTLVPEPASLLMLGLGCLALRLGARRRPD